MRRVTRWMAEHAFSLATEKIDVVLLTEERVPVPTPPLPIHFYETLVLSKRRLHNRYKYEGQMGRFAIPEAAVRIYTIYRLMSQITGHIK